MADNIVLSYPMWNCHAVSWPQWVVLEPGCRTPISPPQRSSKNMTHAISDPYPCLNSNWKASKSSISSSVHWSYCTITSTSFPKNWLDTEWPMAYWRGESKPPEDVKEQLPPSTPFTRHAPPSPLTSQGEGSGEQVAKLTAIRTLMSHKVHVHVSVDIFESRSAPAELWILAKTFSWQHYAAPHIGLDIAFWEVSVL